MDPLRLPGRDDDPDGAADRTDGDRARRAARREHFLHALFELSRELSVALDVYGTADLLLFNLMGQLGSARAALWLLTEQQRLAMVRCLGFESRALRSAILAAEPALLQHVRRSPAPAPSWRLAEEIGGVEFQLLRQLDVALVAPLYGNGELLGVLALGSRVDRRPYDADDLETLATALGMVGMSLQNSRLYNRVLENNRQLRLSNERLLEHDRLKEQFLSNVNHELRTPLAVVQATLECLARLAPEGDRSRDLLTGALQKTHQLRGMIENLLVLSDATRDRLEFAIEPVELGPLLDQFVAERRAGVTEGLREFVYERADGMLAARCDRARLVQILNELLDNAVKFTSAGAVIGLGAAPEEWDGTRWISLHVQDDGPGIPTEHMGSLFRSFEQGDGSSTRRAGGLGVGLAFALELATRMGCRLEVTSPPGHGTRCTVRVPVA
jgi:signal transduction histidine kinase